MFVVVFFFQAEDGIRDLVRSRGLGDVYKRQGRGLVELDDGGRERDAAAAPVHPARPGRARTACTVSYTHLTLPTSDLV